jgi:hypothetical protein
MREYVGRGDFVRRFCWLVLMVGFGGSVAALAQTGTIESCAIDSFEYREDNGRLLVSGEATCEEARLELAIFDEQTGEKIAENFTYIIDSNFEIHLNAPVPEAIRVEYSIE